MSLLQCPAVDWKVIRSAFIRARGGRRQEDIAKEGRLHQSAISKLEANDNLGPAVEVFTKAIEGLGMPVSEFFLQIERSQDPSLTRLLEPPKNQGLLSKGSPDGRQIPDVDLLVDDVLLELASRIGSRARTPGRAKTTPRATAHAGPAKSAPRKRRA
jgi:hypothetical protein